MQSRFAVVCMRCGHYAMAAREPRGTGHWLCSQCGGIGAAASEVECLECGTPIAAARLNAVPATRTCIACASRRDFQAARIDEPWGTRDDFKRDRNRWGH